jgi:hypothetical protein
VLRDGYRVTFMSVRGLSAGMFGWAITSSVGAGRRDRSQPAAGEDVEAEVGGDLRSIRRAVRRARRRPGRITASRSGKTPTTSVRRRISSLSRSEELFLQIWRRTS